MIIVDELINASRKAIGKAIDSKDSNIIRKVAKDQHDVGADYIDVNAGIFVEREIDHLKWTVKEVQTVVDGPCCIDSPNPKAIEEIVKRFDGIHTICGLPNISFGLPNRSYLNQTFAVMAVTKGLDGLIVNPLDKRMMANLIAAETLAGRDEYCGKYLEAYRGKRFEL